MKTEIKVKLDTVAIIVSTYLDTLGSLPGPIHSYSELKMRSC